jgi:N-acetylglucosaminyl-diphospho-decaprenol L-rhamnosyltransferase
VKVEAGESRHKAIAAAPRSPTHMPCPQTCEGGLADRRAKYVDVVGPPQLNAVPLSASAQTAHVDCAVVVVTYNSEQDIARLLDSLPMAALGLKLRTIVVDNGSADATLQHARKYLGVTCVEVGVNMGYAAAINIGRRCAGVCSALLVLNPDVILEAGALREMFDALERSAAGIVVPMLLDEQGHRLASLRRKPTLTRAIGDAMLGDHLGWRPGWLSEIVRSDVRYERPNTVEWATGAAMLISAACDSTVGSWDERFFLYSEEVDYAARADAAGFKIQYVPAARARHRGGGSGQSAMLIALLSINRIRYMEKIRRLPSAYRAVVIMHELLRSGDPSHRAALRAVMRRSSWPQVMLSVREGINGSGSDAT